MFHKQGPGSRDQGQRITATEVVEGTDSGEVAIMTEATTGDMKEDRGTSNLKFILKNQKIQNTNKNKAKQRL